MLLIFQKPILKLRGTNVSRSRDVLVRCGDPGNHRNEFVRVLYVPGLASQFLLVSHDEPLEVGGAVQGAVIPRLTPRLKQCGEVRELRVEVTVSTGTLNSWQIRL